jgi:hypothetical protein
MIYRGAMQALLFAALGVVSLWAEPAFAALGADAPSVSADSAEMHGTVTAQARQYYDIEEITAEGMRVRQYVNRDGIVFAVGWSGPVAPNLQRLLGVHYGTYAAALTTLNGPGLHRSVRLASLGLVVESGGHLRAYVGRAYLPALIPDGATAAELR